MVCPLATLKLSHDSVFLHTVSGVRSEGVRSEGVRSEGVRSEGVRSEG